MPDGLAGDQAEAFQLQDHLMGTVVHIGTFGLHTQLWVCLLYTSDAADERTSGDRGGRRTKQHT